MFHATIHNGSDQPFHVSGRVAPYDLELLREHVLAHGRAGTRVEIRLADAKRGELLRALGSIVRRGVELHIAP